MQKSIKNINYQKVFAANKCFNSSVVVPSQGFIFFMLHLKRYLIRK